MQKNPNDIDIKYVTSPSEVKLPFRIIRACRCSFEVEFEDGVIAFISNQNLYRFINNEVHCYAITIRHNLQNHTDMPWVIVCTSIWTNGLMSRCGTIFDAVGRPISR